MAAKGRGPDSQLVHMSDREVAGLQALAKAHGGSLTVNPETGLAEAGVLDNLLPAIVGAGLAYATGGASLGASIGLPALSNAAVIVPPKETAPLKVTKSFVTQPCATSCTVITEEPTCAVKGLDKLAASRIGVIS